MDVHKLSAMAVVQRHGRLWSRVQYQQEPRV